MSGVKYTYFSTSSHPPPTLSDLDINYKEPIMDWQKLDKRYNGFGLPSPSNYYALSPTKPSYLTNNNTNDLKTTYADPYIHNEFFEKRRKENEEFYRLNQAKSNEFIRNTSYFDTAISKTTGFFNNYRTERALNLHSSTAPRYTPKMGTPGFKHGGTSIYGTDISEVPKSAGYYSSKGLYTVNVGMNQNHILHPSKLDDNYLYKKIYNETLGLTNYDPERYEIFMERSPCKFESTSLNDSNDFSLGFYSNQQSSFQKNEFTTPNKLARIDGNIMRDSSSQKGIHKRTPIIQKETDINHQVNSVGDESKKILFDVSKQDNTNNIQHEFDEKHNTNSSEAYSNRLKEILKEAEAEKTTLDGENVQFEQTMMETNHNDNELHDKQGLLKLNDSFDVGNIFDPKNVLGNPTPIISDYNNIRGMHDFGNSTKQKANFVTTPKNLYENIEILNKNNKTIMNMLSQPSNVVKQSTQPSSSRKFTQEATFSKLNQLTPNTSGERRRVRNSTNIRDSPDSRSPYNKHNEENKNYNNRNVVNQITSPIDKNLQIICSRPTNTVATNTSTNIINNALTSPTPPVLLSIRDRNDNIGSLQSGAGSPLIPIRDSTNSNFTPPSKNEFKKESSQVDKSTFNSCNVSIYTQVSSPNGNANITVDLKPSIETNDNKVLSEFTKQFSLRGTTATEIAMAKVEKHDKNEYFDNNEEEDNNLTQVSATSNFINIEEPIVQAKESKVSPMKINDKYSQDDEQNVTVNNSLQIINNSPIHVKKHTPRNSKLKPGSNCSHSQEDNTPRIQEETLTDISNESTPDITPASIHKTFDTLLDNAPENTISVNTQSQFNQENVDSVVGSVIVQRQSQFLPIDLDNDPPSFYVEHESFPSKHSTNLSSKSKLGSNATSGSNTKPNPVKHIDEKHGKQSLSGESKKADDNSSSASTNRTKDGCQSYNVSADLKQVNTDTLRTYSYNQESVETYPRSKSSTSAKEVNSSNTTSPKSESNNAFNTLSSKNDQTYRHSSLASKSGQQDKAVPQSSDSKQFDTLISNSPPGNLTLGTQEQGSSGYVRSDSMGIYKDADTTQESLPLMDDAKVELHNNTDASDAMNSSDIPFVFSSATQSLQVITNDSMSPYNVADEKYEPEESKPKRRSSIKSSIFDTFSDESIDDSFQIPRTFEELKQVIVEEEERRIRDNSVQNHSDAIVEIHDNSNNVKMHCNSEKTKKKPFTPINNKNGVLSSFTPNNKRKLTFTNISPQTPSTVRYLTQDSDKQDGSGNRGISKTPISKSATQEYLNPSPRGSPNQPLNSVGKNANQSATVSDKTDALSSKGSNLYASEEGIQTYNSLTSTTSNENSHSANHQSVTPERTTNAHQMETPDSNFDRMSPEHRYYSPKSTTSKNESPMTMVHEPNAAHDNQQIDQSQQINSQHSPNTPPNNIAKQSPGTYDNHSYTNRYSSQESSVSRRGLQANVSDSSFSANSTPSAAHNDSSLPSWAHISAHSQNNQSEAALLSPLPVDDVVLYDASSNKEMYNDTSKSNEQVKTSPVPSPMIDGTYDDSSLYNYTLNERRNESLSPTNMFNKVSSPHDNTADPIVPIDRLSSANSSPTGQISLHSGVGDSVNTNNKFISPLKNVTLEYVAQHSSPTPNGDNTNSLKRSPVLNKIVDEIINTTSSDDLKSHRTEFVKANSIDDEEVDNDHNTSFYENVSDSLDLVNTAKPVNVEENSEASIPSAMYEENIPSSSNKETNSTSFTGNNSSDKLSSFEKTERMVKQEYGEISSTTEPQTEKTDSFEKTEALVKQMDDSGEPDWPLSHSIDLHVSVSNDEEEDDYEGFNSEYVQRLLKKYENAEFEDEEEEKVEIRNKIVHFSPNVKLQSDRMRDVSYEDESYEDGFEFEQYSDDVSDGLSNKVAKKAHLKSKVQVFVNNTKYNN